MATYVRNFYHMLNTANQVTLRNTRVRCWPNSEARAKIVWRQEQGNEKLNLLLMVAGFTFMQATGMSRNSKLL